MKNKKFNKRNFGLRLILWPFVFGIIFIAHNFFVLKRTYHFLKYGGEYVNFEKNESENIVGILKMLKEMKEERGEKPTICPNCDQECEPVPTVFACNKCHYDKL